MWRGLDRVAAVVVAMGVALGTASEAAAGGLGEVGFVVVDAPGAELAAAALVETAAANRFGELGFRVLAPGAAAAHGLTAAKLIACPPKDPACVRALVARAGVGWLLRVEMASSRDAEGEARVVLTGRLIDPASGMRLGVAQRFCERCQAAERLAVVTGDLVTALAHEAAGLGETAVVIRSRPPGARVTIDGEPVGVTELRHGLHPGEHQVRLELAGYEAEAVSTSVAAGELKVVQVDLAARRPDDPAGGRPLAVLKWLAIGTGLAGIAAGVTLIALDQPPTETDHEHPEGRDSLWPGVAVAGGGAVLLATGAIMWKLDRPPSRRAQAAAMPARGGVVLGVGGAF